MKDEVSIPVIGVTEMPHSALHGDHGCLRSRPSRARELVSTLAGAAPTAPAFRLQYAPRLTQLREWAAGNITRHHYLGSMPDTRTSFEVFVIYLSADLVGALVFGRPEATRCGDWYGGVDDVASGRCEVTRWQVLNLARVWIAPEYQKGGTKFGAVPGYIDRHGEFRSTLASDAIKLAAQVIGFEYLNLRPPVFPDEPYQIEWLLSYCDTSKHRGTIYRAAGFELFRTNERGIQTWRIRLPSMTDEQDATIRQRSRNDGRAKSYRAARMRERAQIPLLAAQTAPAYHQGTGEVIA